MSAKSDDVVYGGPQLKFEFNFELKVIGFWLVSEEEKKISSGCVINLCGVMHPL
jgi:hypothetical protein